MSLIAYLINQYPKVSHSFYSAAEITSVEAYGIRVSGFRPFLRTELVDEADKLEQVCSLKKLG